MRFSFSFEGFLFLLFVCNYVHSVGIRGGLAGLRPSLNTRYLNDDLLQELFCEDM